MIDSRKIVRVSESLGLKMFVFEDGSVSLASDIALSLWEEVQCLRLYGNKDCTYMADQRLDGERK